MKKIWIIRHVDYERLGYIPGVLQDLGLPYESISLSKGDLLPELGDLRGVIDMGGDMSAYQINDYPFFIDEMEFMKEVVRRNIPFLGICLGAQLLAQAFGAEVKKNSDGYELGWLPLEKTVMGKQDRVFGDLDIPLLFQLHGDSFSIPEGSVNLLSTQSTSNQCLRVGDNAYGIQFHPEMNEEMMVSVFDEYKKNLSQEEKVMVLKDVAHCSKNGRVFLKELLMRLFLFPT